MLPVDQRPLISLVMIVKDEAAILRETLDLVAPYADEFVIVDTGSTDDTPAIIADYGPVHRMPFVNFIETKNAALDLATGRYILLMDADERLVHGGETLREWAAEDRIDCVDGWILEGDPHRPTLRYSRPRLWRNDGRWRFQGPGCHEYLTCAGPETTCLDHRVIVFHDHRHRNPDSYAARNQLYIDLLQTAIDADPADTRAWFYLGRTYQDADLPLHAISAYQFYLALQPTWRDEIYQVHLDSARLLRDLGEYDAARSRANMAIDTDPRRAEAYLVLGELAYTAQDWPAAIHHLETARRCTPPSDVALFLEPHAYTTIPADYLTICYDRLHRPDLALAATLHAFNTPAPSERIRKNLVWCRRRSRPTVLFALGPTPEPLPADLDAQGAGGVETTYLELPPVLADMNFNVFVAGRCGEHQKDRAYYLPYQDLPAANLSPDIVIATRWFEPFTWYTDAKHVLWLQDAWFADCAETLGRAHSAVVSSPWHRTYVLQRYGHSVQPDRLHVIPLGIDLRRFRQSPSIHSLHLPAHAQMSVPDLRYHAIYSSNPDRGLVELAQMWPALRSALPDLTLTVTYGWEGLATWNDSPDWRAHLEHTRAAIEKTMTPDTGVTFTGRLGKQRLAMEMQRASILLYPNNFQETFCLTALEAQAAGVPIVSSHLGALATTVHPDAGLLLHGHPSTPDYQARFVAAAVDLLRDPAARTRMAHAGIAHARQHDWATVAQQWQRLIWRLR